MEVRSRLDLIVFAEGGIRSACMEIILLEVQRGFVVDLLDN
jgi:hypothetical protein